MKLILLQLLQSKTEQIEFRGGKEITSKLINEKQKLKKPFKLCLTIQLLAIVFFFLPMQMKTQIQVKKKTEQKNINDTENENPIAPNWTVEPMAFQ